MRTDCYSDGYPPIDLDSRETMRRLTAAVQRRLGPFILRSIRDPHLADDLMQETLLTLIERTGDLQRVRRFWPWIYRVAQSKIQNHFRQQMRWGLVQCDARRENAHRFRSRYEEPKVLDRMIRAEHAGRLCDALEAMDRRHQQIVRLRWFEHWPYAKIATGTQTSEGQARTHLHRVKCSLRKQLHARPT